MIIQHNISSLNANRQLQINTDNKKKATERLSSGYRINRAADDAAGLTISEKMRWNIRGLDQASRNIEDGISLTQVGDSGMQEIHNILQRQRELTIQAGNDTNTDQDRYAIQREIDALSVEITKIANDTTFNTIPILNRAGNLTHGPVTSDTAVTTLLTTPGSSPNGTITGFMATNTEGSIHSRLLYGGNSAGTSPFQANVTVGGTTYRMQSGGSLPSNCSVTNTPTADGVESTFTYHDAGGSDIFSITRTMTRIDNPTGSGQVYKMDFQVQNHTSDSMSVNLEMGLDVMFEGNDNPSFLMDGDSHETVITRAVKYTADAGNIPGVINLFDPDNPYLNVQCIVNSHGATAPDYVKIGQYGSIMGDAWRDNAAIGDSMYTVGWDNISVGAGGASSSFTTMYGVSDPMLNPVLSGNHSVPVEINIQSSSIANNVIVIPLVNCTAESLGVDNLDVSDNSICQVAIKNIDQAIDKVSGYRTQMGTISNRLEKAMNVVNDIGENTQAAESRIRDADMAEEMVVYSKHNILEQSGQSMLAQAGKMNESVLTLLQ